MLKIITTVILCLGMYSFADVQSTRDILSHYSSNDPKVLESYDRLTKSWIEYKVSRKNLFDLEKLLKAVEFAAEKHAGQMGEDAETPYIISPIGVCELLWNAGTIRNVSILTSALLQDTLVSTDATEAEIETLFGLRILYTVKEVTNDPALSSEENELVKILEMSLDGQLIKLAENLYNVKGLYPQPTGWTDEKIERSYFWAEKLLSSLAGINLGLESTLKTQIADYRNKITGHHIVVNYRRNIFSMDDNSRGEITHHAAILDNDTVWWIEYKLYQKLNLVLYKYGEKVEIKSLGDNTHYLMIIHENNETSSKNILFSKINDKNFEAFLKSN